MKELNLGKIGAAAIAMIVGLFGGYVAPHTGVGTDAVPADDAAAEDTKQDKVQILSYYIYSQARLNEVPVLDVSIASTEEMSAAYVDAVNDKMITDPKPDLFETLHDEAVKNGEQCAKI